MTHKQKIKALIEAGEKATAQHWQYEEDRDSVVAVSRAHSDTLGPLERWDADLFGNFYKVADARYAAQAANARDSIKLLAEIAEAGEKLLAETVAWQPNDTADGLYCQFCGATHSGRRDQVRTHQDDCVWLAHKTLLAKYKEAQDG